MQIEQLPQLMAHLIGPVNFLAQTTTIPGVSTDIISSDGQAAVNQLFMVLHDLAFKLLFLLLVVAGGMAVIGLGKKWTYTEILLQIAFTIMLMVSMPRIYETVLATGAWAAELIYPAGSIQQLNTNFNQTFQNQREGQPLSVPTNDATWYQVLAVAVDSITPGPGQLTSMLMGIAYIFFFIVMTLCTCIWKVTAIVLYLSGLICCAFAVIPGWGKKITANWFGAVVILSALQPWFCICAWFNDKAKLFFLQKSFPTTISGVLGMDFAHKLEAIGISILMAFLYGLGYFIIPAIFPLSRINATVTEGLIAAGAIVYNTASNVTSSVTKSASRVITGGAA